MERRIPLEGVKMTLQNALRNAADLLYHHPNIERAHETKAKAIALQKAVDTFIEHADAFLLTSSPAYAELLALVNKHAERNGRANPNWRKSLLRKASLPETMANKRKKEGFSRFVSALVRAGLASEAIGDLKRTQDDLWRDELRQLVAMENPDAVRAALQAKTFQREKLAGFAKSIGAKIKIKRDGKLNRKATIESIVEECLHVKASLEL